MSLYFMVLNRDEQRKRRELLGDIIQGDVIVNDNHSEAFIASRPASPVGPQKTQLELLVDRIHAVEDGLQQLENDVIELYRLVNQ